MLSKKSKIEQLPKCRESRFLAAAASASLCRTRTKLCGRLLVIRRGPSHRRARDAPAALKTFLHPPEKPFSTVSVIKRLADGVSRATGLHPKPNHAAASARGLPSQIREIVLCSLSPFFARPVPLLALAQPRSRLLNDLIAAAIRPAYWSIR